MRPRLAQGFLVGVIALCGLAIFLAFMAWRARTSPQVGEDFTRLTPQEQQQRRAAARPLTEQAGDIVRAARRKEQRPFALTASEQQLNTLLQDRVRVGNLPVRDLRVGLDAERLALQGRIIYKGIDATMTLTGNIAARDGKLHYEAEKLHVSGIPVSSLKKKVGRQVTEALNHWFEKAPGRIERVAIADKHLTIEGVTK
jgi:hypothetical protein